MRFGHARGYGANAHLGHQLHRNSRRGIYVLQIVDQLRQILDGINVVMRRRGNQTNAGDGMAHARDYFIHFVARQLAAFAGLGALGDLDLQLVGVHQVVGRDAEARRSHLLDRATPPVAIGIACKALFVFPALAGIGLPADAVHRNGQRLVRLFADGPERHGAGGEALHDFPGRLHFFDRHRLLRQLELHQAAQGAQSLCFGYSPALSIPGMSRSSPAGRRAAAC